MYVFWFMWANSCQLKQNKKGQLKNTNKRQENDEVISPNIKD